MLNNFQLDNLVNHSSVILVRLKLVKILILHQFRDFSIVFYSLKCLICVPNKQIQNRVEKCKIFKRLIPIYTLCLIIRNK